MTESLKDLQDFFFDSAASGYAGDGPKVDFPHEPGFMGYRIERGVYRYEDKYCVNGIFSCGRSLIWHKGQPIWFMHYSGFSQSEDASRLVKKSLRAAYAKRLFLGGRGVQELREGRLAYQNSPIGYFTKFRGQDFVTDLNDGETTLFTHDYSGGLLAES